MSIAGALVAALAIGTGVFAYWTADGSGSATASVGTLTEPGKPSGSDTGGAIDLTWAASTVTGGGIVEYHVERRADPGSSWTDACGSSESSPITDTSCTDGPLGYGDYVYRVTAIFRSWTAASEESDAIHVADTTPPDFGDPALTITGLFGANAFQFLAGTTLFYNPQAANSGSFTVEAENVDDPESGVDKIAFPTLDGFLTGGGDDGTSPYATTYDWDATATASGSQTVTAYNGDGGTSTTTFTMTPDVLDPSGGALTANGSATDSYDVSGTIALSKTDFTDGESGIASNAVTRASGTLIGNVCGALSGNDAVTISSGHDADTLETGCYRYTLTGTDNVGNTATTTSAIVKVDTTPPSTPTLSFSNVTGSTYYAGSGTEIFFRPSGAGQFDIDASSADADTSIAGYTFPANLGTNWSTAGSGASRTYSYTAGAADPGTKNVHSTNNAGADSSNSPFTVTADSTAPTSGSITANGSASDSYNTTGTIALTKTNFTDGQSGIASNVLTRASAPLSANICGTFSGATVVSTPSDSGLANGCYRYTLTGTDNVGNVATADSAIVKVDTTPPDSFTPSLSNASGNTYISGSVVYINPQSGKSGSFQASASPNDADTAIQKVQFPSLAGFSSGGGDVNDPGPYETTYSWSGTVGASGSQTVTAYNNASLTRDETFTVTPDTTAPTGQTIALTSVPASGYYTTASVAVSMVFGTDAGSGLDVGSLNLERDEAPLTAGSCGAFPGTFAASVGNPDNTVASGKCYRYRFRVSDRVGNEALSNVTADAKVDTVAPTLSDLNLAAASAASVTGTTLSWGVPSTTKSFQFVASMTDAESGPASVLFPAIGTTGWTHSAQTVSGGSPYTSSAYTWLASASNPTGYSITLTDAAGNTTVQAITFVKDTTSPTAFSINGLPNPQDGIPDTGDQIVYTFNELMDPASIKAGWNGSSTTVSVRFDTNNFGGCAASTGDCMSVVGVNLGGVGLGATGYTQNHGQAFDLAAVMAMTTVSGRSVITLQLTANSARPAINTNTVLTWLPSSSAKDMQGNSASTASIAEPAAKRNF